MAYWLIEYRRSTGELTQCSPYADAKVAQMLRFSLEDFWRADPDVEVVVLGADSLEQLKATHARYFCTVAELAERMQATLR